MNPSLGMGEAPCLRVDGTVSQRSAQNAQMNMISIVSQMEPIIQQCIDLSKDAFCHAVLVPSLSVLHHGRQFHFFILAT
jgi:hypothetical protein